MSLTAIYNWFASLDARIWQAVIAGGFVSLGWMVNGWQNRRQATALRAERLRDFHRALYAEIGTYLANLDSDVALETYRDQLVERMTQEADFIPFMPREHNDRVFRSLVPDIHILPRTSIDPVVAYYSQLATIETLVDDMRGEAFKNLSVERRVLIYRDYIELKRQALAFGNHALRVIEAFAEGGKVGALQIEAELKTVANRTGSQQPAPNNPAADPSDRLQE